jgi:hypothetical protein
MNSSPNAEGRVPHLDFSEIQTDDLYHRDIRDDKGVFLDPDLDKTKGLKVTADQHVVLVLQPSDDPRDPLRWSFGKKHTVLAVVIVCSFLPDYGSVTGAATLILQAK